MDYTLWHSHILGKGTGAAVVAAGNAKHAALVAEVDFPAQAMWTRAAEDGGIESYTVALAEAGDSCTQDGGCSGSLMSHDEWRYAAPR